MTHEDFKDWLVANDCRFEIVEGLNLTGTSLKVVNKHFPENFTYVSGPFDERPVPNTVIREACERLVISSPDCVQEKKDDTKPEAEKAPKPRFTGKTKL